MVHSSATAIPIGAVTRLTGISGHTLRKWESRYRVIEPIRTDSGRRLYSRDQLGKLILLRDLTARGHQISQLARLDLAELSALAEQTPQDGEAGQPEIAFEEIVVVGRPLAAMFAAEFGGETHAPFELIPVAAADWVTKLATIAPAAEAAARALVIDVPTLSEPLVAAILDLRKTRFARVTVAYGFATRAMSRRLLDGGILCLKSPVSVRDVLRNLGHARTGCTAIELLAGGVIPTHRYSEDSIARLAAIAPTVKCECPNHIASLLIAISAFEQYSLECEDTEPAERELHARLRLIAANARALFEEALKSVAAAEGLPLEEL